jgi:hypothetical protein
MASLKPFPRQIRSYPATHIRKLAQGIDRFGWVIPIVTDHQDRVVAGWALRLAAQRLGLTEVPVVTVTELSDEELRGLRIALNRLSEDSAWDRQELAIELQELVDLGFEIELTGFETAEIEALRALLADIGAGRIDVVVVHKVDRLTRSLTDFAKIVEVFDARGVSFVSITQHFCPVRTRGHRRAHPRQDRGLKEERTLDGWLRAHWLQRQRADPCHQRTRGS